MNIDEIIYANIVKECLHEPIIIPLKPHEELSIHFTKNCMNVYCNVILYIEDKEKHLYLFDPYYHEILFGYMFLIFQIMAQDIPNIHIELGYDREQETFILLNYTID